MKTWIALFRGINVGGKNVVIMKDLRQLLEEVGLSSVKSYIQSGNVVFAAKQTRATLSKKIKTAIGDNHGFTPELMLFDQQEFEEMAENNPFPQASADPKTLHLFMMNQTPAAPDLDKIKQLQSETEQFQLLDNVFYLYAPEGIGRSKLAEKTERLLGEPATARNWRTISKLLDLARENNQ